MSLLRTIGTRVPAVASIEQAIANPSKRSYETLRAVRQHEAKRRQRGRQRRLHSDTTNE